MKIETVHNKIKSAISTAERISKKQSVTPILSCIYFETVNSNSVMIKSTNLDLGFEILVPAKIKEEGSCAIPAAVISAFLSNIQDSNRAVNIETNDSIVKINAGQAEGSIRAVSSEDFPLIPHSKSNNPFFPNINAGSKLFISPPT